jgi:hypothetical protein
MFSVRAPVPVDGGDSLLADGAEPAAGGAPPVAGGTPPVADGADPVADGAEPVAGGAQLVAGGAQPVADGAEPELGGAVLVSRVDVFAAGGVVSEIFLKLNTVDELFLFLV